MWQQLSTYYYKGLTPGFDERQFSRHAKGAALPRPCGDVPAKLGGWATLRTAQSRGELLPAVEVVSEAAFFVITPKEIYIRVPLALP